MMGTRWRQYVSPKRWHLPTSPHGAKTQKMIIRHTEVSASYEHGKLAQNWGIISKFKENVSRYLKISVSMFTIIKNNEGGNNPRFK
jgi:hypothetical protein